MLFTTQKKEVCTTRCCKPVPKDKMECTNCKVVAKGFYLKL